MKEHSIVYFLYTLLTVPTHYTVGAPYFVISETENRTKKGEPLQNKGTQNKGPHCSEIFVRSRKVSLFG